MTGLIRTSLVRSGLIRTILIRKGVIRSDLICDLLEKVFLEIAGLYGARSSFLIGVCLSNGAFCCDHGSLFVFSSFDNSLEIYCMYVDRGTIPIYTIYTVTAEDLFL